MSNIENQTPSQSHEEEFNQETDIDLLMVNTASRRIVEDQPEPSQVDSDKYTKARKVAIGAATGAALLVGLGTGVAGLANASENSITFSEETATHTVADGEGTLSIVDSIPGSDTADRVAVANYIESRPDNAEVYKDGLQAGERVSVPVSINGAEAKE